MLRDLSKPTGKKSHHHHHGSSGQGQVKSTSNDQDDSVSDFPLHCDDLTFRELEFRLVRNDNDFLKYILQSYMCKSVKFEQGAQWVKPEQ